MILILSGILALGMIAAVLSANLYIESKDSQARIENKISRMLRVPVKITATRFSLWSGLQVKGITIAQDQPENNGNFFEAGSFSAGLEYWPLLNRKLTIKQISISRPELTWFQNSKGKWRAPTLPEQPKAPGEPKPPGLETTEPVARKGEPLKPFEVSVGNLVVSDGAFRFYDNQKKSLFEFLGVTGEGRLVSGSEAHGKAASATTQIRDLVTMQNLRTEFSYANKNLVLQPILAGIAGGDFRGDFKMDVADNNNPFSFKGEFKNVDVNRLVTEGGGPSGQVTGELSGNLDIVSNGHKFKDFKGTGKISLARGKFQQYDFFQMLGQALQIEELSQLNLQQAELNFRLEEGKTLVDELLLQSPNLKLTATGTIKMDGKMKLLARLAVNKNISRQLPGFVLENFHPLEGGDLQYLDFEVTGTVSKPKTNLLEIAIGKKIEKEMGGLLNSLFGNKKKKESKKPAPGEVSAPETPAQEDPLSPAPSPSPALTPKPKLPTEPLK